MIALTLFPPKTSLAVKSIMFIFLKMLTVRLDLIVITLGLYASLYDFDDDFLSPLSVLPFYSNIFWPPPSWLRSNPAALCVDPSPLPPSGPLFV